jgi:PHD/YefM family antitoxin component YafN of YafNO toxin-antitoxin module
MKYSKSIKPVSYLKSHLAEIMHNFEENEESTVIVTQNGEAKAVFQDIRSYEATQDALALLKILTTTTNEVRQGRTKPLKKAFEELRARVKRKE